MFESVQAYLTQNPNAGGLVLVAIGVLIFVGALLKWEWILSPSHKRSILRALFGERGSMFILSVMLMAAGLAIFFLYGKL